MLTKFFRMTDDVWRRHANPWSVWTRFPILPLLGLAVWSRVWIGYWAWVPSLILIIWVWVNPRFFNAPASFDSWASQAVLGEKVWTARHSQPIAAHHKPVITALILLQFTGFILAVWGLAVLHAWAAASGIGMVLISKLWFLDRMVWIYHEQSSNARVKS